MALKWTCAKECTNTPTAGAFAYQNVGTCWWSERERGGRNDRGKRKQRREGEKEGENEEGGGGGGEKDREKREKERERDVGHSV